MESKVNEGASSSGKKTLKRKHITLTLNQKLEIIKMLERGINRNVIMSKFKVGSSTIYDKKQKDKLQVFVAESAAPTKHTGLRQTLKMAKMAQLVVALFKWFSAKRSEGKPITGPVLIEKAKQFHSQMNINKSCVFRGWLRNFKDRHGIRKLDISGEQKSANHVAAEEYSAIFEQLVEEHRLSPCQMYNADETGLLWHCLPNSTLVGGGEKAAHGFKMNKDRITVLVCANASGTHKLKLLVIGKYKKPRAFKTLTSLPVIYEAQGNAWMMSEIFKDFFNPFVLAVKENFRKEGLPEDSKAVILLDNCRAHPPASELVAKIFPLTYLPPNVTSLLQPMDQGLIQNFKGTSVQKLVNSDCSVSEFQSDFNLKDAVYVAALPWVTVRKCWRKLWPSIMFCDDSSDEEEFCGFNVRPKHISNIQEIIENVSE
uniref:HTH CENPB-type domain-containing protein n=1 Tax=Pelodiscus sinensis TaxID=13735 RepID=K7GDC9_PELSI